MGKLNLSARWSAAGEPEQSVELAVEVVADVSTVVAEAADELNFTTKSRS